MTRQGGEDQIHKPVLGVTRSGSWGAYPAEDWIILSQEQARSLLPMTVAVGKSWDLDRNTAARVLERFYPSTENNDLATNRIDEQELKGTVLWIKNGLARARLDGGLRMKHPFYHRDDNNVVDAKLLGYLDFDTESRRITDWQLVTTEATYGRMAFGVAVRLTTTNR